MNGEVHCCCGACGREQEEHGGEDANKYAEVVCDTDSELAQVGDGFDAEAAWVGWVERDGYGIGEGDRVSGVGSHHDCDGDFRCTRECVWAEDDGSVELLVSGASLDYSCDGEAAVEDPHCGTGSGVDGAQRCCCITAEPCRAGDEGRCLHLQRCSGD